MSFPRSQDDQGRRAHTRFPADPASAGRARSFTAQTCEEWEVTGSIASATLVVTELVENTVEHSQTDCHVTLELHDDVLTIAVSDQGHGAPRMKNPGPYQPGGRGLKLVEAVADQWGFTPTHAGKTVWAEIGVDGGRQRADVRSTLVPPTQHQ